MRPGPRLIPILLVTAVLGLAAAFWPVLAYVWYGSLGLIFILVMVDVFYLRKMSCRLAKRTR